MIGTACYSLFLAAGVLYSGAIFKGKSLGFTLWTGGIIGSIALMLGIIPLSLVFGFTKIAHIILALLFTLGLIPVLKPQSPQRPQKPYMPAVFAVSAVGITTCILLANHVLMPADGGAATGQSTYGDLAMHLGFITSIAEQKAFPPMYNLLAGEELRYPFLFDSLSSSLMIFGAPLRTAVLYPSFVFAFLLPAGFYFLAEKLTGSRKSAVLAVILFFFGGGFGFAYFFDGAAESPQLFTRLFTDFYHTPTNFNEHNIRWANPICDMIIPQRTTMAGWAVLLFALWLLADALESGGRKKYLLLGLTAGAMPMIHTHSFLALGILSAALFFLNLPGAADKKRYFTDWCVYGAAALIIALPQLVYWTFAQSVGNEHFVRIFAGWVNRADPHLWFWLKNWGITALFALPALLAAKGAAKKFGLSAAILFALAELVLFQPNEYDNNKLFFVSYMLLVILTADYLITLYGRMSGIGGRRIIAAVTLAAGVLSGVLTIGREYKSGGEYQMFSSADFEFAEFLRENTALNAVFASGTQHLNPVCALAGRTVYAGSSLYIYYHGYAEEMTARYAALERLYQSKTPSELAFALPRDTKIDYILLSEAERAQYNITEAAFSELREVYRKEGISLYEVKY